MFIGHVVIGILLFQLFSPEYFGGGFAWMRLKWWRVMLPLRRKWLTDCLLGTVGVLQGLQYKGNLMTCMAL